MCQVGMRIKPNRLSGSQKGKRKGPLPTCWGCGGPSWGTTVYTQEFSKNTKRPVRGVAMEALIKRD